MQKTSRVSVMTLGLLLSIGFMMSAQAQVAVDKYVTVNFIWVADDAGNNAAPTLGSKEASVLTIVNSIYAPAGIGIVFKDTPVTTYNDSFTLWGTNPENYYDENHWRPDSDFDVIFDRAANPNYKPEQGQFLDADPYVLNIFMVQIVPYFEKLGNNYVCGLAYLGGNGIAMWLGPSTGAQTLAMVLAHEIGHNLGLDHPDEYSNPALIAGATYDSWTNLMYSGTDPDIPNSSTRNVQLTPEQIAIARASDFAQSVPEPATLVLLTIGGLLLNRRRRAA